MPSIAVQNCAEKVGSDRKFRELTEALFCLEALALAVTVAVAGGVETSRVGNREYNDGGAEKEVHKSSQFIQQILRYVYMDGIGLQWKQPPDVSTVSSLPMHAQKDPPHQSNQQQQQLLILASLNRISSRNNAGYNFSYDIYRNNPDEDSSSFCASVTASFYHILELLFHAESSCSLCVSNSRSVKNSMGCSREPAAIGKNTGISSSSYSNRELDPVTMTAASASTRGHKRESECESLSISTWVRDDDLEALYTNLLSIPVPMGYRPSKTSTHPIFALQSHKKIAPTAATASTYDSVTKKKKIESSSEDISKFIYYPLLECSLLPLSADSQMLVIRGVSAKLNGFIGMLPSILNGGGNDNNDIKYKNDGNDDNTNSDMHKEHPIAMYSIISTATQCTVQALAVVGEVISKKSNREVDDIPSNHFNTIFDCVGNISSELLCLLHSYLYK